MPPGLTPQSHKHNPSRAPEIRGKESSTAHSYFPACKLHREFCKHGHLRVQGTCRKRHNAVTPKSSQSRSSRIELLLKSTARRSRSPCSCSPGCWRLNCRLGKCKTGGARLQKQGWGRWLKALLEKVATENCGVGKQDRTDRAKAPALAHLSRSSLSP